MCSTGLTVRLRRWWKTRRCASADGEKDENISGGSVARTQSAICRPPTIVVRYLGELQPNYLGPHGPQGKNGDAPDIDRRHQNNFTTHPKAGCGSQPASVRPVRRRRIRPRRIRPRRRRPRPAALIAASEPAASLAASTVAAPTEPAVAAAAAAQPAAAQPAAAVAASPLAAAAALAAAATVTVAAAAVAQPASAVAVVAGRHLHDQGLPADGGPGVQHRPDCRHCNVRPHRQLGRLGHHRHELALL